MYAATALLPLLHSSFKWMAQQLSYMKAATTPLGEWRCSSLMWLPQQLSSVNAATALLCECRKSFPDLFRVWRSYSIWKACQYNSFLAEWIANVCEFSPERNCSLQVYFNSFWVISSSVRKWFFMDFHEFSMHGLSKLTLKKPAHMSMSYFLKTLHS